MTHQDIKNAPDRVYHYGFRIITFTMVVLSVVLDILFHTLNICDQNLEIFYA